MNTVPVELSVDQLKRALRKLPAKEKVAIWRMLDSEAEINRVVHEARKAKYDTNRS